MRPLQHLSAIWQRELVTGKICSSARFSALDEGKPPILAFLRTESWYRAQRLSTVPVQSQG